MRGLVPPQIVEDGGDRVDFGVDGRAEGGVVRQDEGAEEPGAHDVLVDEGAAVGAGLGLGCADERGVDYGDAGYGAEGLGFGYVG